MNYVLHRRKLRLRGLSVQVQGGNSPGIQPYDVVLNAVIFVLIMYWLDAWHFLAIRFKEQKSEKACVAAISWRDSSLGPEPGGLAPNLTLPSLRSPRKTLCPSARGAPSLHHCLPWLHLSVSFGRHSPSSGSNLATTAFLRWVFLGMVCLWALPLQPVYKQVDSINFCVVSSLRGFYSLLSNHTVCAF